MRHYKELAIENLEPVARALETLEGIQGGVSVRRALLEVRDGDHPANAVVAVIDIVRSETDPLSLAIQDIDPGDPMPDEDGGLEA